MRVLLVVAYLDRFGTAPDLDGPVAPRLGVNKGSFALPDRDLTSQQRGQPYRVCPGRFVLIYPYPRSEHPDANAAGRLVLPGPHPGQVVVSGRTRERVHLGGGIQLGML